MDYNILCHPTFSVLEMELQPGEKIVSEAGAMAWMSSNIRTETSTRGGMFAGLKRAMLAGESFFQNTYTAEGGTGTVGLSAGSAGAIIPHELTTGELLLEKSAYLASVESVKCDSKWQGFKGILSEGLFVLRVTGSGLLFFTAYGAIHEVDVQGEYIVDNGYAVAWEPTLQYKLTRARKIRSFLFADQILLRFSGRGKLWVQSRSPYSLANWVYPFRRVESKK